MKLYRKIMKRYAPGANVERRLPRVRHGGRVDDRRGAPQGRARISTRDGLVKVVSDSLNLSGNPFLLPGIALKTAGRRPLPDRADGAAALAEGRLEELRRALGLPRRVGRSFPAACRGSGRCGTCPEEQGLPVTGTGAGVAT